ncbi:S24/S26 family peptidase [Oleiharenicola sp. Vm1]|uniref:S24/S26 family peptidase n=1 Tax=Oleiharenicola sp. Vm1 TaxID=3398393 RepID=UPI0039F50455
MVRLTARCAARIFLLLAAWWTSASAFDETGDAWIRGVFTGHSPRPLATSESEAWQRAGEIVGATPDTFTLVGGGESMQPLYPPGTILVLRAVGFAELRPGQTAVYRNRAQRPVAHVLIAKCRDGWRVRGLNNARHDDEAVVTENLLGVVIAAFTPHPSSGAEPRRIAR